MALGDCFSSVSEAMEYFMPFRILDSHKVNERYSDSSAGWVFWTNNPNQNSIAHCSVEERIRRVLITCFRPSDKYCIVQFWGIKRVAGSKCMLTTSHQPFGIKGLKKGYYSYRNECMRRTINVGPEADEVQLGPSGRAFRNGSVEFSPHIQSYNIQEFPLRDHAILCPLRSLVSLPVFELDSNNVVGVLELLCPEYNMDYPDSFLAIKLKEVGLRINYNGPSESVDREKYLEDAAEEVHNMFKKVAKTHPLSLGLAFAPCGKEHCLNCSGVGCLDKPIAVYRDPHMRRLHKLHTERNGISSRAYASGKSCFCRDIRNFSILEYPLAHHARLAGLTFSVATCVQSVQDEISNVLVLEFLLLPGSYDIENIRLFTGSLLIKIKELLPYYKVAGEDFPGEELFPQIYDSLKYDEIGHVHVGDNPVSLPVTLTCSCDRPNDICEFDHEKEVVDFFLPVNLSYEVSRTKEFVKGNSDDEERSSNDEERSSDDEERSSDVEENIHDVLVLWGNDVEECDGVDECIKLVFKRVPMKPYIVDLVQFWAPRRIASISFLTTFDQPFAISKVIRKVTCLYRIECMRRIIYVDKEGNNEEQLGPVGRAFKNGVVEYSPDVGLYTIQEFPLRDHAALWDIRRAMFLPVFELHGKSTVGVLEILIRYAWELDAYLSRLAMELKEMGLRIDYVHRQPGQSHSLDEIEDLFDAVSVRYPLCFARTLTPCLSDYCHDNSSLEYINHIWSRSSMYVVDGFLMACNFHQLPDKNGVAGKALTSHRTCFCIYIGNWGIKDYPISHYAELLGCNFSVAIPICVDNTQLVDTPCVLEFFLLPGDYSIEYIGGLLDSLLRSVKQHLPPNFKILSEDIPGEPLFLEIGKHLANGSKAIFSGMHGVAGGETNLVPQENNSGTHIADYQENISNIHVDGTENIYEMHGADGIEANSVPEGENICEMRVADGIGETTLVHQGENNCSTRPSSSQMEGSKFHVRFDQLRLQFGNTLDEAAKNLGVSRSTLKRIRKVHGIHRWPSHKKNKVNPSLFMKQNTNDAPHIAASEADSTRQVLPMQTCINSTHELQTNQHQTLSYRDSEVDKIVSIKASYGHRKFIKFKLNTKSTLKDLREQVTKRLKWEASMFEITYQDEAKDWVTIFIDRDLKDCLQGSIDRCESTVSMSINLRLD